MLESGLVNQRKLQPEPDDVSPIRSFVETARTYESVCECDAPFYIHQSEVRLTRLSSIILRMRGIEREADDARSQGTFDTALAAIFLTLNFSAKQQMGILGNLFT